MNTLFSQFEGRLVKVTASAGLGNLIECWGILQRRLPAGFATTKASNGDFFWQLDVDVEVQGNLKRSGAILESEILLVEEIDKVNFLATREKQAEDARPSNIVGVGALPRA